MAVRAAVRLARGNGGVGAGFGGAGGSRGRARRLRLPKPLPALARIRVGRSARRLHRREAARSDGRAADRGACGDLRLGTARSPPSPAGGRGRGGLRGGRRRVPQRAAADLARGLRDARPDPGLVERDLEPVPGREVRRSAHAVGLPLHRRRDRIDHPRRPGARAPAAGGAMALGRSAATPSCSPCIRSAPGISSSSASRSRSPPASGLGLLVAQLGLRRPAGIALALLVALFVAGAFVKQKNEIAGAAHRRAARDRLGRAPAAHPHAAGTARRLGPAARPLSRAPPDAGPADRHVDRADRGRGTAARRRPPADRPDASRRGDHRPHVPDEAGDRQRDPRAVRAPLHYQLHPGYVDIYLDRRR